MFIFITKYTNPIKNRINTQTRKEVSIERTLVSILTFVQPSLFQQYFLIRLDTPFSTFPLSTT